MKAGTEDLKELRGQLEEKGGQQGQGCQDEGESEDAQSEFDLREVLRRGVLKERDSYVRHCQRQMSCSLWGARSGRRNSKASLRCWCVS